MYMALEIHSVSQNEFRPSVLQDILDTEYSQFKFASHKCSFTSAYLCNSWRASKQHLALQVANCCQNQGYL